MAAWAAAPARRRSSVGHDPVMPACRSFFAVAVAVDAVDIVPIIVSPVVGFQQPSRRSNSVRPALAGIPPEPPNSNRHLGDPAATVQIRR